MATANRKRVFALVLAHCHEGPGRAGEVVLVEGPCLLGTAGLRGDSPPRALLLRQRPGTNQACEQLQAGRLPRRLLSLEPREDRLLVEPASRLELRVNGTPVSSAEVTSGDVLALEDELLFLVARRPPMLARLEGWPAPPHAFGAADPAGVLGEGPAAWALRARLGAAPMGSKATVLLHAPAGADKVSVARALSLAP